MDEKKFRELKNQVEDAKREAAEALGACNQLHDQLKKEFKVKSLDEAENLLETFKKNLEKSERDYERALAEYERRWK